MKLDNSRVKEIKYIKLCIAGKHSATICAKKLKEKAIITVGGIGTQISVWQIYSPYAPSTYTTQTQLMCCVVQNNNTCLLCNQQHN